MKDVPIVLPGFGPSMHMVSRAQLGGSTVLGQLDFPPRTEMALKDHFDRRLLLPGTIKMYLMSQGVADFLWKVTDGKEVPIFTGMPMVTFPRSTQPGPLRFEANIFLDGAGGFAECRFVSPGNDTVHATANFAFNRAPAENKESALLAPFQKVEAKLSGTYGSITADWIYTGKEIIKLDNLTETPWPFVLEGLGQTAVQIGHECEIVQKGLFVVTHLRGTQFYQKAPLGTIDFHTEVTWYGPKRGLVYAAASVDGNKITDGHFGFAVLAPMQH